MWRQLFCLVVFAAVLYAPSPGLAGLTPLGSAQDFAVLGHETVTNVPTSTIVGNVGVSPGTSITGFNSTSGLAVSDPQVTGGQVHSNTAVAAQALIDAGKAYTGLKNMPFTADLTGKDLGTVGPLVSGVYHFDSSAQLTGTLKLDAQHNDNAFWVFQIGSDLTTASSSAVQVTNLGPNGGKDDGLFWVLGTTGTAGLGSATLGGGVGAGTAFEGNILALTSITLITQSSILNGRALALNGAVTLGANTIQNVCPIGGPGNGGPGYSGGLEFDTNGELVPVNPAVVPLPGALLLFVSGMGSVFAFGRKFFSVS
jgi:hypothetical protein